MTFDNTKQLEQNNVVANIGRDNISTLVGIFLNIIIIIIIIMIVYSTFLQHKLNYKVGH